MRALHWLAAVGLVEKHVVRAGAASTPVCTVAGGLGVTPKEALLAKRRAIFLRHNAALDARGVAEGGEIDALAVHSISNGIGGGVANNDKEPISGELLSRASHLAGLNDGVHMGLPHRGVGESWVGHTISRDPVPSGEVEVWHVLQEMVV